jgi:agmatine deiminase
MPAEWLPHTRCWMAWPSNPAIWTNGMDEARRSFATVVRAILEFEPVSLLVRAEDRARAYQLCGSAVEYFEYPLDDSWMRDFGPTFVVNNEGGLAGVNWRFNGWGKYPHDSDQHVATTVLAHESIACIEAPLVLEGGAIHVDGAGTVLTTEQCLLNANRNPAMSREEIEAAVLKYVGADTMIWLNRGLKDDDTDGHIDELACFVKPGVALAMVGSDKSDIDYQPLQENLAILKNAIDARGQKLEVVTVEQPRVAYKGKERLSQSYINFYMANGGIVMPAFNDSARDSAARGTLQELFPTRKIIQLPGQSLAVGGGNIHCITQQQPDPHAVISNGSISNEVKRGDV